MAPPMSGRRVARPVSELALAAGELPQALHHRTAPRPHHRQESLRVAVHSLLLLRHAALRQYVDTAADMLTKIGALAGKVAGLRDEIAGLGVLEVEVLQDPEGVPRTRRSPLPIADLVEALLEATDLRREIDGLAGHGGSNRSLLSQATSIVGLRRSSRSIRLMSRSSPMKSRSTLLLILSASGSSKSWKSIKRRRISRTRASVSPVVVNASRTSGTRVAASRISSTLVLPEKRSSVNASNDGPTLLWLSTSV